LAVEIKGNRGSQQKIPVSTNISKEIGTISTGIPNLGL